MGLHLIGQVMGVDDGVGDSGGLQPVEGMVDEGAAVDLDQGLGQGVGDRPHAGAEAGGQDHGSPERFLGHRLQAPAAEQGGIVLLSAAMWASNQAATGARAGCSSAASSSRHTRGIWTR